ncbi:MAG: hypothetical protein ABI621_09925 [Chloroflexota bacterium]
MIANQTDLLTPDLIIFVSNSCVFLVRLKEFEGERPSIRSLHLTTSSLESMVDSVLDNPVTGWDRYSYVRNNPMIYTDPSGHLPCLSCALLESVGAFFGWSPDYRGISIAEALVTNGDTITAAGMAVQSEWYLEAWDDPSNPASSSYGPAQITQAEIDEYELSGQNLHDPTISVQVMTNRINNVVSACPNCIDRDKLILAALAQNGSEYTLNALADVSGPQYGRLENGGLNWKKYFNSLNSKGNL